MQLLVQFIIYHHGSLLNTLFSHRLDAFFIPLSPLMKTDRTFVRGRDRFLTFFDTVLLHCIIVFRQERTSPVSHTHTYTCVCIYCTIIDAIFRVWLLFSTHSSLLSSVTACSDFAAFTISNLSLFVLFKLPKSKNCATHLLPNETSCIKYIINTSQNYSNYLLQMPDDFFYYIFWGIPC